MRVRSSNNSDLMKLKRLVKYLKGTLKLFLTLGIKDFSFMRWYVDASFALHPDFRSHSERVMTCGQGAILTGLMKQNINSRSSTSAEIVVVDNFSTKIL